MSEKGACRLSGRHGRGFSGPPRPAEAIVAKWNGWVAVSAFHGLGARLNPQH